MAGQLKNIKLILAYEGTRYHGWQRQKNDVTIQQVIEEGLQKMTRAPVSLVSSGRTDAGVHAVGQVCNFLTRTGIDPESIKRGLNSILPKDILIREAEYVSPDFHARYRARLKTYEYRILNRPEPDLFQRNYLWHIRIPLDREKMQGALSILKGQQDFSSFRSSGSGNTNPVRNITKAQLHVSEKGFMRFVFEADGFLRHMVRNIVGTVVEAGTGRVDHDKFCEILEARDRSMAGAKAPPQGLFLMEVLY